MSEPLEPADRRLLWRASFGSAGAGLLALLGLDRLLSVTFFDAAGLGLLVALVSSWLFLASGVWLCLLVILLADRHDRSFQTHMK